MLPVVANQPAQRNADNDQQHHHADGIDQQNQVVEFPKTLGILGGLRQQQQSGNPQDRADGQQHLESDAFYG